MEENSEHVILLVPAHRTLQRVAGSSLSVTTLCYEMLHIQLQDTAVDCHSLSRTITRYVQHSYLEELRELKP